METEEQLKQILNKAGLFCYQAHLDIENTYPIEFDDIVNLMNFVKDHRIDTVFYEYGFTNQDALAIDEDSYADYNFDQDLINLLQPEFYKYNDLVSQLDFSQPISLYIYCIYQGMIVSASEYDYWFEEKGIEMPSTFILELATKYMDRYAQQKQSAKEHAIEYQKQLYNQIISDTEFHKCTNISLRRRYLADLLNERPEIRNSFSMDHSMMEFIENIWSDFKSQNQNTRKS